MRNTVYGFLMQFGFQKHMSNLNDVQGLRTQWHKTWGLCNIIIILQRPQVLCRFDCELSRQQSWILHIHFLSENEQHDFTLGPDFEQNNSSFSDIYTKCSEIQNKVLKVLNFKTIFVNLTKSVVVFWVKVHIFWLGHKI